LVCFPGRRTKHVVHENKKEELGPAKVTPISPTTDSRDAHRQ
jgi:hypothetical protein